MGARSRRMPSARSRSFMRVGWSAVFEACLRRLLYSLFFQPVSLLFEVAESLLRKVVGSG